MLTKSKSWIEKQMFIIYSIFLKFTINSWRDICLSLLFVNHILGGTENHMRISLLFLNIFRSSITVTRLNPNASNGRVLIKTTFVIVFQSIDDTI